MNLKSLKQVSIIFLVFALLFTIGCTDAQSVIMHEKFKEELKKEEAFRQQLLSEGLMKKLNKKVSVDNGEVIIKEIIFDTNVFTITYEVPKQLNFLKIDIRGKNDINKKLANLTGFQTNNQSTTFYTNPSVSTVPVYHQLQLINQQVNLDIQINNKHKEVTIEFPGEKIAKLTKEVLYSKQGAEVKEVKDAVARVNIGISSVWVESKGLNKELVVLDLREKRVLESHNGVSSGEDEIQYFGPLPIPRKDIKVKFLYPEKVILLSY